MKIFLYGLILLLYLSCSNSDKESGPKQDTDSTQKPKAYFPVIDFIKSEIKFVDSLPVGIMKYSTQNGITDSGYIKIEEFHQLAREFLLADLNEGTFENNFSETSFFDNTTQHASFLYSSKKKNLQVSRVDVLAKPEDIVYNKVKSIYIEKSDSSVIKKMLWKAGQSFQINTEIRAPGQQAKTTQIKVVWNPWN